MPENRYNLLAERLIKVTAGSSPPQTLSLPEVLAALASGEQLEFAALQAYQFHPWHAFLVQVAALAAHSQGRGDVSAIGAAANWQQALRALTDARDEPWCLVVEDLRMPAFMQPPVPEGSLDGWKDDNATDTPDAIDLLQTAKNHDVKMERIAAPRPEHWVFALVALQTMQGYSGKDNYGIARMNKGYSNRPSFAAARDLAWPTRFIRDANLLLAARGEIAADRSFDSETGRALLWLEPWNGVGQLGVDDLDPFFIEICRRIRLTGDHDAIVARWTTSKAARIAAEEQKGNLGDLWVPVKVEDAAALTAHDLHYETLQEILFSGVYKPSRASKVQGVDGDEPLLFCQLFAREQGKTEGYHERFIPIPPKARSLLATEEGRRRLGALSKQRLDQVKEVPKKALRPALAALLQAGPEKLDYRDKRIEPFAEPFDREVDRVFFPELFADIELSPEASRVKWLKRLLDFARQTLEQAKESAPTPAARRFRARAAADRVFNGAAHRMRAAAGEFTGQEGESDEPRTDN